MGGRERGGGRTEVLKAIVRTRIELDVLEVFPCVSKFFANIKRLQCQDRAGTESRNMFSHVSSLFSLSLLLSAPLHPPTTIAHIAASALRSSPASPRGPDAFADQLHSRALSAPDLDGLSRPECRRQEVRIATSTAPYLCSLTVPVREVSTETVDRDGVGWH